MRHGDYGTARWGAARGKGRCICVPAYAAAPHVKPVPGTSIQIVARRLPGLRQVVDRQAVSPSSMGRRRALLSAMRRASSRAIRIFAKCRCAYNFQVSVDRTIGSAFADCSIAYASHRRTRIARCHSQLRRSSADARDCSDPSGLATLHCGPSRARPYRSQLRPHSGIECDIPPEHRDTRRSR